MLTKPAVPVARPSCTPTELLDEFVVERIRYRVNRVTIKFELSDDAREDLRQAMIAELLRAAKRFDPATARWHTFACGVLKMYAHRVAVDLARTAEQPAGSPTSLDANLPAFRNQLCDRHDDIGDVERRLDVAAVLAKMPPRVRELCELLKVMTRNQAAKKLGVHLSWVYRQVAVARACFEEAGIKIS